MKECVQCVWLKRDLRLTDHAPLVEAAASGPVLVLYIIEPEVIRTPDFDALHWNFIRESLVELQSSLSRCGTPLQVITGDVVAVFNRLSGQFRIAALWAHGPLSVSWPILICFR